jgi:8-amino-7-oxononanoate synthase
MDSLDAFAEEKLAGLQTRTLRRRLTPTARTGGAGLAREGRALVSFSCNDYLGLAHDPRVKAAAIAAVERYGTGAAASRLITGDHPLLGELEDRLARHKGKPAARVFGSGYLTNLGVTPALVGEGDLVLLDALSHSCMAGGARLSGARTHVFHHNDMDHLEALLSAHRGAARRAMVLSERVFSMDGDRAPTAELNALCAAHDAWLMIDDAHGLGVVEDPHKAPLEMGTLSKALGSYGGYLCASAPVADLMISRARTFVYTTGLPPAAAGAALAALDILEAEPARRARPLALARRLTAALGVAQAQSAVVAITVGRAERALQLSAALASQGFAVVAIRPPTVPEGTARLRVALSAAHTEAEVDALADALVSLGAVS